MKRVLLILFALVFTLSFGLTAYAEMKDTERTQTQRDMEYKGEMKSMMDFHGSFKGNDLIGARVENREGENLGKISDLSVDPKTGRVDFAVLSHGGVLGIGDKFIAVPLSAFSVKTDRNGKFDGLVLNMSKDKLAQAPNFDKDHWPNRTEAERTYRYFGQTPYWTSGHTSKSMEHKSTTK